jgi:pyruvate dehydrogenase E2 component (dihydrolipoamide acetyltransferase)
MITIVELPSLSSTMKRGKIVRWHKREGDFVRKGDTLFEVQTDKVNVEVDAPVSGFLRKILLEEGISAAVNTPIAVICDRMEEDISSIAEEKAQAPAVPAPGEEPVREAPEPAKPKISPLARRIAEDLGVDIHTVRGTGPGGRITREDVERTLAEHAQAGPPAKEKPGLAMETSEYEDWSLSEMRKVIARRLQESKANAPHFYVDITADAGAVLQFKKRLDERAEKESVKVSVNDILIKVVARALKEFPMVNAHFLGDRIRVFKAIHIGVAVSVEGGLIVPVVRNADLKSIPEISREVRDLADRARSKRLLPSEFEGGTFTISNMGMFGVESFHAIINPPECGILSAGGILPAVVVVDGQMVVKPCLKLSLSVDHRAVDGALAARCLAYIKELVESPLLILV